jgi:hypothetical protein
MNDSAVFKNQTLEATLAAEASRRFPVTRFKDIKWDAGPEYLIDNFLPRRGLAVIWGPPKEGKSFSIFDLLMHVVFGWEWRGRRTASGPVVYCALEGAHGFKKRVEAFRQARIGESDASDANPPFFLMSERLNLVAEHETLIAAIRAQCANEQPIVICIDTLNRSLVGSESSDVDMSAYVQAADTLREAFDCLVVIIHHCGRDGTRPRGHTSLTGTVDAQISVMKDETGNIVLAVEHLKDGEIGVTITARLVQLEIGVDENGEPATSCLVEPVESQAETTPVAKKQKLTNAEDIAVRALHEAIDELGEIPPASNHIPARTRTVTEEQWKKYADRRGMSSSDLKRSRDRAFERARVGLLAKQRIAMWNPYIWLV